ncbi:MAG TPA: MFS transporter [Dehalococcoidia bacterium]|nr:MFS transporter [Dehalococcoidia bacterium]
MTTTPDRGLVAQARGIFKGVTIDPTPLRESRNFRLLLGGQSINLVGNQISMVAVPYQVFLITHSSLAVGALSLMQFLPLMCMYLIGGSLADMVDRRRLMLITQTLLACTAALLAVGAFLGHPPLWYIFAIAICAAGIQAVDNPTRRASIPRLVPRDQIANALSLNQILSQLGQIAGPAVGGLLLAKAGFGTAYAVNFATFLVSIVAVSMMSPLPPEAGTGLRNPIGAIGESFAFLRDKPILLSNFVVDVNGQIFGLPKALFPALATNVFRNGPAGLGLLYAAPGVGALLGAFLTGWIGRVRRQGRTVVILVAIWGIAIAVFGLFTQFFWLGLLMLAVAGTADMFSAVMRNTILQLVIPDRLRGRLSSVSMMTTTGGPRLGDAEAGAVATLTTPQFSVVSGGLLTVLGCVVVAFAIPVYWNWDAQAAVKYGADPVA